MSKSEGQKMKLFALKEILETETDANHGITMPRIIELLSMRGIKAERKSLYDDIRVFRDTGYLDVTIPQGQHREYSVASRTFELSELKMMIDAIQSSKFLSEAKTRELIKKLEKQCSRHEARSIHHDVVIANRVKSVSTGLFRNVDTIHTAISENSQITFKYFNYDLKKQRKYFNKGGLYAASPWAMIYVDDNYYLLAYEKGKFKHFRVDKMDSVQLSMSQTNLGSCVVPREGTAEFEKYDMSAYTKYTFGMFGGDITPVTMVFQNQMMGVVMDRFGHDVPVIKEDDNHFRITVSVAVSNQFYGWVFGLGKSVRIVAPEHVKEGMRAALTGILARYE